MSAHTSQTELKLIGKLILEGEMHCETGLHVGAGKGSLEIGGRDNPVVKDAFGRPYVPGSSLRGKIRSLLEQSSGLAVPSELVYLSRRKGQEVRIHQSDRPDDEICLLFGRNPGRMERVQGETLDTSQATPARLAVFDAPLDPESITAQMRENLDDELTEVKSENAIDRITSQANPRTLERVPAGARFRTRLVMDVLCEEDAPLFLRVLEGLRLLEDDALGGGGSRGSGRVRFANLRLLWRGRNYYASGAAEKEISAGADARRDSERGRRVGILRSCKTSNEPGTGRQTASRRPLAYRAGFGRAQSRRRDLPQRLAVCGDHLGHAPLGTLEEWLDATARNADAGGLLQFLLPVSRRDRFRGLRRGPSGRRLLPRLLAARVRWKSARFVPLGIVQAILRGSRLDDRPVDGGWPERVPVARRTDRVRSAPGALERGGRPVDRRDGAALHGVHGIPPRRGFVDDRFFRR